MRFQIDGAGNLLNSAINVNLLRDLWVGRSLIKGDDLGPGDPGDFDHGAWHGSCHLLGAGGVRQASDGRFLWLEVGHSEDRDEYLGTITYRTSAGMSTLPLDSAEGRELIASSVVRGFVEGNSRGRTSSRGCNDLPDCFNLWRRQDFDQPIESQLDGGKVWEHWCTLRDLRSVNRSGLSVLSAYVSLASALGDRFAPTVLRGRREYGHPMQLAAMVHCGFVSADSAIADMNPLAIPEDLESCFLHACPRQSLEGVERLEWCDKTLSYYMFGRKLASWSMSSDVLMDLKRFASFDMGKP
jgi:hypothetical protein